MKNIVSFNNRVKCNSCNINGFFCYVSQEACFTKCPLCQNDDYMNDLRESDEEVYNKIFPVQNNNELYEKYFFCGKCRIIFDCGCIHACNNKTKRI